MTLRHFEVFCAVCNTLSMTKAADLLNMTQPSVSLAIKELETFYHTRLFDRINRKIRLTEAGNILRTYASSMLDQYDEVYTVLNDNNTYTKCRFGINASVAETKLPFIIQKIKEVFPLVDLKIIVSNTEKIESKLVSSDIDFAIFDYYRQHPGYTVIPIATEPMSVVCSRDYPCPDRMTIQELVREKLILREKGCGNRENVDAVFASCGLTPTPIVDSGSNLCIINLLHNNMGLSILSRSYLYNQLKEGTLREIKVDDVSFERRYYLVYNKDKYQTHIIQKSIEIIQMAFRMGEFPNRIPMKVVFDKEEKS